MSYAVFAGPASNTPSVDSAALCRIGRVIAAAMAAALHSALLASLLWLLLAGPGFLQDVGSTIPVH